MGGNGGGIDRQRGRGVDTQGSGDLDRAATDGFGNLPVGGDLGEDLAGAVRSPLASSAIPVISPALPKNGLPGFANGDSRAMISSGLRLSNSVIVPRTVARSR